MQCSTHDANERVYANGWPALTPSELQGISKRFAAFDAAVTAKFGCPKWYALSGPILPRGHAAAELTAITQAPHRSRRSRSSVDTSLQLAIRGGS
jgi:hypothetical protein